MEVKNENFEKSCEKFLKWLKENYEVHPHDMWWYGFKAGYASSEQNHKIDYEKSNLYDAGDANVCVEEDCDFDAGFEYGYEIGHEEGFDDGYDEGYEDGYEEGNDDGYSEGYYKGFEKGKKDLNFCKPEEEFNIASNNHGFASNKK